MQSKDGLDTTEAPLMTHLEELRSRLWRAVLAVLLAGICCYGVHDALFNFLTRPLFYALKSLAFEPTISFRTMSGAFLFHFKTAAFCGLFVASPVLFYQLWRFVAPGLYLQERKALFLMSAASTACFIGGAAFAYFEVLTDVYRFLLGYAIVDGPSMQLRPDINIEEYLGFTLKLLCAFAAAFEMPVLVSLLAYCGLCTHRTLLKFWRYAMVLCFVLGAFLTPPDIISQLMLALPMIALYFISIGLAYLLTRRREGQKEDSECAK